MTKKELIQSKALSLFAEYGFHAISTARIATDSNVSEGLIFKHFKSKRGLLENIYADLGSRLEKLFTPILEERNPKNAISIYIDTIFDSDEAEYPFWKLIFKLKWDNDFYKPDEIKPIIEKLTWAFKELDYSNPEMEAIMLVHTMENISVAVLRDGKAAHIQMSSFLKSRYKIN